MKTSIFSKISVFVTGLMLPIFLFFLLPTLHSYAVPARDATLEMKVSKVSDGKESLLVAQYGKYIVQKGDDIMVEIRLLNPSEQKVISAETWVSFDPHILTGVKIENGDSSFDLVTPGENEFAPDEKVVRIGRGNTTGGVSKTQASVAKIYFKVIGEKAKETTNLSFYDFSENELGHTNVNVMSDGLPFNILSSKAPAGLSLYVNATSVPKPQEQNPVVPSQPNNNSTVPSSNNGTKSPTPSSPTGGSTTIPWKSSSSVLSVPTNVSATTKDQEITVSWKAGAGDGAWYYVYYTKHQNQYLHRKKVLGTSLTLSGLTNGDRYYFVITSSNNSNFESAYSSEVSIIVGSQSSMEVHQEISPQALESLQKISNVPATGPSEYLIILFLSFLVYPIYKKFFRKSSFQLIS